MGNYIKLMNNSLKKMFRNTSKISHSFSFKWLLMKTYCKQQKAIGVRNKLERKGIHIPPFLIASITNRCNLHCQGCYAQAFHTATARELSTEKWNRVFQEASELGISFILLAGGEPFTRMDIINAAGNYPKIIFPVFTNATMLSEGIVKTLRKMKNLIPVISIEGTRKMTDERRGADISEKTEEAMELLKLHRIFYGLSFTVTKTNLITITGDDFLKKYTELGCKVFFFVEYVPAVSDTVYLVISAEERIWLDQRLSQLRETYPALFIAFPGDEKKYGGCLSSGRGFAHINANGNLEPCPFAPYSDTNLNDCSLKDALNSEFLKAIREHNDQLQELDNGCALFYKKEWLQTLIRK